MQTLKTVSRDPSWRWLVTLLNGKTIPAVDLQRRYGSKGLQIVGLNVGGAEDYEKVPEFAREFRIQYQLGIPDPDLEDLYMSDDASIPQTFILDRNGVIVKRFIGYDDSLPAELESAIQSSLEAR